MKKIIFQLFILGFAFFSCVDDKGNYSYKDADDVMPVKIEGLKDTVIAYTLTSLSLKPELIGLENEENYNFFWYTYYSSSIERDTIARTRNLENYIVTLDPKSEPAYYILKYEVHDKRTNLRKYKDIRLFVRSDFSNGWFVLKDENNMTDLDFINEDGEVIPDIIETANGRKLEGEGVKVAFQAQNYDRQELNDEGNLVTVRYSAFHVLSTNDICSFNANSLELFEDKEGYYYEKPDVIKPQNILYQSMGGLFVINDNKISGLYTSMANVGKMDVYKAGEYEIHEDMIFNGSYGYEVMFFDKLTRSFRSVNSYSPNLFTIANPGSSAAVQISPTNMNYDLIRLLSRAVSTNSSYYNAYSIMKEINTGEYVVFETRFSGNGSFPFRGIYNISSSSLLLTSKVMEANRTATYIYFGIDNNLYTHMVTALSDEELQNDGVSREKLAYSFPSDETISYIEHYRRTGTTYDLLILTNSPAGWKLYTFSMIDQTVEFNQSPTAVYTGKGNARHVIYR